MHTLPITIQIPAPHKSFLESYTRRHQVTLSQLIDTFVEQLQVVEGYTVHPDLRELSGILPADIDGQQEYYAQFEEIS